MKKVVIAVVAVLAVAAAAAALFIGLKSNSEKPASLATGPAQAGGQLLLSAEAPPSLEGFLQAAPEPIGKPGTDFPLLQTGEATDWGETPVPLVNPLGAKTLYYNVKYPGVTSYVEMSYLQGISEITHRFYGDNWIIDLNDENLTTNYLRWYAQEIGATLYENTDNRVTFSLTKGDELWWATALWDDPQDKNTTLHVVKQKILPFEQTLTIRADDTKDGKYSFTTKAGSGDFISAIAEIAGGERATAYITATQYTTTGLLSRSFDYRKELIARECRRYALDDIPQTDEPLYWTINFAASSADYNRPDSISIRLEKTGTIAPVTISDRLGSLRVVGALGGAESEAQSAISKLVHEDGFSYGGVVDGNGHTVFHLPAGYYTIRAKLPGEGGGGIRMVPVNGGELTEVVLPAEFKSTYASFETLYGNFNTNAGSISIMDNKDGGDTAEVAILINDPLQRDVFPEKEDITVTEGGAKGEVTKIERRTAPVNVVLVIDTSGSMKDFMQPTIEAAKRFVAGLPDKTNIRLVSFEQNITEHKGDGKEAVLKALDTLKAVGGTSLYDAADKGLSLLSGIDNAFLVVFSDGADSRELKNQGRGSTLTRDQIVGKLAGSETTVLTIGFGEGHDPIALMAISDANKKGAYFPAADEAGLDQAFAAAAGKFGNEFVITYKRPQLLTDFKSEQPVVGVMIDDSGSMSSYRDAVIAMFHDFFSALPPGSLTQFSKFGTTVDMMHITTDQKAVLMQAMGETGQTGGGTEVLKALQGAVEQLRPLPTNKKVFVFLTDDAMNEVEYYKLQAEKIFARFREEGIRALFVGVNVSTGTEQAFQSAAALTNGDYVITKDIAEVEKKLQELLQKVSTPMLDEESLPFAIGIKAKTEDGSIMDYFAVKKLLGFAPKTAAGQIQAPKAPQIATGGKMIPLYEKKTADLISGGLKPGKDALKITSHVSYQEDEKPPAEAEKAAPSTLTGSQSYGKTGKNSLLEMTVKEAYTFDVLSGVETHSTKQFTALHVEINFPAKSSGPEAYQIPSVLQHFYLSLNNGAPVPASRATWLAAQPLAAPGETQVTVKKGEKKSGVLVFHTEKPQILTQLALHYYDTAHGHIQIPLAGKLQENLADIAALPPSPPAQITEAFSMTVTGKGDQEEYGTYKPVRNREPDDPALRQDTILRTIQAKFDSKVQALLQLDPKERFYYVIETEEGPLMTKMNDIVHNIPLGFTGDTLLAPGASNTVYLPYELPAALGEASSYLLGDVSSGSLSLPVTGGRPAKTATAGARFSHEYFDVTVNALCPSPFSRSYLVLDITVQDKKDGFGTTGLDQAFALENTATSDNNRRYVEADEKTKEALFGIDEKWAVFDGGSRRGIFLFYAPETPETYTLRSPYFSGMAVKAQSEPCAYPELLALKHPVPIDKNFQDNLDQAVSAAIARYKANRAKTESPIQPVGLSAEEVTGSDLPAPAASAFGDRVLESLDSLQDFYRLMYALRWLPGDQHAQNIYYYAPEAVLTQGWGAQADLYNLAENALARLGIKASCREVILTQKGKEALAFLSGMQDTRTNRLPALAYTDDSGQSRIFVIPFMREITELSGLLYLPSGQNQSRPQAATARMTITALAEGAPDKGSGQAGLFEAFAQAAGGGENEDGAKVEKEITLFEKDLSIPALSLGAVDIGYYAAAKSENGGEIIKAVVDTTDGLLQGNDAVDTGKDQVKAVSVKMNFSYAPDGGYVHTSRLKEGERLPDICHTLAFGLPEMSEKAVQLLTETSAQEAKLAEAETNNASKVRWFTRGALYRYIAARTAYDQETAQQLNLVLGRVSQPLALMITARSDGTNAAAGIDLMHHQNQVLQGEEHQTNAYKIFSGMFASVLEGKALPDGKGAGILDVWQSLPRRTDFMLIEATREARSKALEAMPGHYPEVLLSRVQLALEKNNDTVFLVPAAPGKIGGQPRWAWLEIDESTFDTISVFDTGERSGMASYSLGLMSNKDMQQYVGYFIGLSCATWSVSAYALEFDDYQEIKANAAMLCAEVLSKLEDFLSMAESGPSNYIKSKIKERVKKKLEEEIKERVDIGDINIGDIKKFTDPKIEIPRGFAQGFKQAVEVYFGLQ